MNYRLESNEVLVSTAELSVVDRRSIAELKRLARANPSRRVRLCGHPGPEDPVHEMLVVHPAEAYVRPHKHLFRSESIFLLEGFLSLHLFDDRGAVRETVRLGPVGSAEPFYYRLARGRFHHLVVESETAVFHEITNGPLVPEETVFAAWSPEPDDPAGIEAFRSALRE